MTGPSGQAVGEVTLTLAEERAGGRGLGRVGGGPWGDARRGDWQQDGEGQQRSDDGGAGGGADAHGEPPGSSGPADPDLVAHRAPAAVRDACSEGAGDMRLLELRLLGAIEALAGDGRAIELGGRRARAVLALLALRAGQVVPDDVLITEVWADRPPPSARNALQSYVSRLRAALPDGTRRLVRRGTGYRLMLDGRELDVARFERAVAEASASLEDCRPEDARAACRRAFAEWRGEPLAELDDEPFARTAATCLTERWLEAVEIDAEAALLAGAHRSVVPRLDEAVAAHPLRETLWRCLLIALYRSGRQVDALRRYEEARRLLGEQVGVEPGPALRAVHLAILRQDLAVA